MRKPSTFFVWLEPPQVRGATPAADIIVKLRCRLRQVTRTFVYFNVFGCQGLIIDEFGWQLLSFTRDVWTSKPTSSHLGDPYTVIIRATQ